MKFKSKLSALLISTAMVLGLGATIGAVAGKDPVKASAAIDTDKYTLVTSDNQSSLLSTGDSIVLYNATKDVGVTGYSGKDATVDAISTNWMNFEITVSGSTFIALNKTDSKYISSNASNAFTIAANSTSAAALFAGSAGEMSYTDSKSTKRILYNNGTYYRCYKPSTTFTPFCIYKVVSADVVTSISASPSSVSLNAGETVATPTVTATLNGVSGTAYSNYQSEIGSLSGSTFTRRTDFVFGTTAVTATDNNIRITANNPTVSGGSEYATFDIALTVSVPTLESISLSPSADSIYVGDTYGLSSIVVTPTPSGASNAVSWSIASTNPTSCATLEGTTVTAVSAGTAVIRATSTSVPTITADLTLTIGSVTSKTIVLSSNNATTYTVLSTSTFSTYINNTEDITPVSMTYFKVAASSKGSSSTTEKSAMCIGNNDTTGGALSFSLPANFWATKVVISAQTDYIEHDTLLTVNEIGKTVKSNVASDFIYYPFSNKVNISTDARMFAASITIYATIESDLVASFGQYFLDDVVAGCDPTGAQNNVVVDNWNNSGLVYLSLSSTIQTEISGTTADKTGTAIQQAVKMYDYVVGKYGSTTYDNYMSRAVVQLSGYNPLSDNVNNDSYMALIVIIGLIGFTSVGAFFYVRKHKEQ